MNPKVDKYLGNIEKWQKEMERLRAIILDCGLTEELKWGTPCYSFQNTNIVIIGVLKDSCVISFFKGSLLNDSSGILSKPGENTQSSRLVRFSSVKEIIDLEPTLKAYIYEAIEVEKAGVKVSLVNKNKHVLPEELRNKLEHSPALKTAFNSLTPGRQRAYILYFSAPKQSKTRLSRIEKLVPQILRGKGLNDDYKKK